MLKLKKEDALARLHLANKARKKIPLYEKRNDLEVQVPFLDVSRNQTRYVRFYKIDGLWAFIEVVD
jgi:hypothetical protein